jgi:hypothetical protein
LGNSTVWGLSDVDVQASLILHLSDSQLVGAGVRLIAPTGGDTLGSSKWQIMSGATARYTFAKGNGADYFEPLFLYDQSFAGDPTKRNIGNLQF